MGMPVAVVCVVCVTSAADPYDVPYGAVVVVVVLCTTAGCWMAIPCRGTSPAGLGPAVLLMAAGKAINGDL